MIARVSAAGRRIALGTGLLLHGLGERLSPGGCGPLLVRSGGTLLALLFAVRLLARAPHLVAVVPVVWLLAAWHVSDKSATPPPKGAGALRDVSADESYRIARGALDPNGVMCILHPTGEDNPHHDL